ncbi:MAG: hypothetical protein LBD48_04565 [Treponema sp.]|jgi:UPF0042 nucleotide-binding protein|nr:hypothetical protein [Treponema sp.]
MSAFLGKTSADSVEAENAPITLVSFGFKYGEESGDLVFNARFLPNPFYIDSLRPLTGTDTACSDYVFSFPVARETLRLLKEISLVMINTFQEQRIPLKICIGCTGGQHRSVALIEALAQELAAAGFTVSVRHREMEAGRIPAP